MQRSFRLRVNSVAINSGLDSEAAICPDKLLSVAVAGASDNQQDFPDFRPGRKVVRWHIAERMPILPIFLGPDR